MNVKTGFASLAVVMLLAFLTHPAVSAVTLAVQDNPVQAGSTDVPVPITVSSDELLAGASFTISYSEELTFLGVSSTFFDTFLAQGFLAEDLPLCDLDGDGVLDPGECDPDGDGVPEADEFFEQPLIVSAESTPSGGKKEIMIAAARVDVPNPSGTDTVILTLNFDTPLITTTGTTVYEVDIKRSVIENASAGYDVPTVIPMLVGYDETQVAPADQYPQIFVSNVLPAFPEVGLLDGTLTVTDGDLDDDDINDQWELTNAQDGTLGYFSKGGDKDSDGYSDDLEFQYLLISKLDLDGVPYHPDVPNACCDDGYVAPSSGAGFLPSIYLLLLLED